MPTSGYQMLDIGKHIWCHAIFFEFHSILTRSSKTLHVFLVWKQSSSGAVFLVKNMCCSVLQWKQTHRRLTWATEMCKDHCIMKKEKKPYLKDEKLWTYRLDPPVRPCHCSWCQSSKVLQVHLLHIQNTGRRLVNLVAQLFLLACPIIGRSVSNRWVDTWQTAKIFASHVFHISFLSAEWDVFLTAYMRRLMRTLNEFA